MAIIMTINDTDIKLVKIGRINRPGSRDTF